MIELKEKCEKCKGFEFNFKAGGRFAPPYQNLCGVCVPDRRARLMTQVEHEALLNGVADIEKMIVGVEATLKQGIKNDTGKPAFDLIEPHFLEDVAKVLTVGAKKYDVDNWKRGMSLGKAMGGVMRHLWAVLKGEWLDPETGLSHLAHATCGIMFIHYFKRTDGFKPDDRWTK